MKSMVESYSSTILVQKLLNKGIDVNEIGEVELSIDQLDKSRGTRLVLKVFDTNHQYIDESMIFLDSILSFELDHDHLLDKVLYLIDVISISNGHIERLISESDIDHVLKTFNNEVSRIKLLESLKEDVEDFVNKSMFIIGADKIRETLQKLDGVRQLNYTDSVS